MKNVKTLRDRLELMSACQEAVNWVGDRDLEAAWAECERADWMLWFAARTKCDRVLLVRAACACARRALKYVPEGEDRPRLAIEAAGRWADKPTRKNQAAARAAESAARAAAWAAAMAAARAAAMAAAMAAARAAARAASDAAMAAELKIMAGMVREIIPVSKLK